MKYSRILGCQQSAGLLAAVVGVSQWSCSTSNTATQVDAGNPNNVVGCGALSAADATNITAQKLDAILRAGLTSLATVDDSPVLARFLTLGRETRITPSADGISNLDDLTKTIREDWLTTDNVETTGDNAVTFKLNPENVCKNVGVMSSIGDAGVSYTADHQDCINRYTNHPVRFLVTRIKCDAGDNVHVDVLLDSNKEKVMWVELAGNTATASVDVGKLVNYSNSIEPISKTSSETTVFDASPSGVFSAELDVAGTNKAHLVVSLDPALLVGAKTTFNAADAGVTDTSLVSISIGAKQNLLIADADAALKTLQFSVGLSQMQVDFPFDAFTNIFSRDAAAGVKHSESVSLRIPAVNGAFSYAAAGDTLNATGLDIGQSSSTIAHGNDSLLSWDSNATTGRELAFTATAQTNGEVGLAFSVPFDVHIKYALLSVQSMIVNPQPFTLDDDIDFKVSGTNARVTLLPDANNHLNLVGSLSGSLLRVDTGTFEATSRAVPTANAVVNAGQCLNRNPSATGAHAMLQTLSGGTCQ